MSRRHHVLVALLALLALPSHARAQTAWSDRGYVSANATYQVTTTSFGTLVHPTEFVEPATVDTAYRVKAIPGFDVGGGVRLWRNLAVGVNVSRLSKSGSGSISAQLPHPFFFNRPRTVAGDAGGLTRQETAVDAQAVWMLPAGGRWQVALAGGPTWFNVGQDLVQDVTVAQSYPYDTAAFAGAVSHRATASRLGFNAGADATYLVAPHVGVGIGIKYSRARVPLPQSGSDTVTVDAGGARVAGGIRFRF